MLRSLILQLHLNNRNHEYSRRNYSTVYLAWNQKDLASYKREFAKIWAEGAEYIDPFGHYKNVDELATFAYESMKIMPDRVFEIHKKPEGHHHYVKYEWKATFGGGVNIGTDIITYDDNFKINPLCILNNADF